MRIWALSLDNDSEIAQILARSPKMNAHRIPLALSSNLPLRKQTARFGKGDVVSKWIIWKTVDECAIWPKQMDDAGSAFGLYEYDRRTIRRPDSRVMLVGVGVRIHLHLVSTLDLAGNSLREIVYFGVLRRSHNPSLVCMSQNIRAAG